MTSHKSYLPLVLFTALILCMPAQGVSAHDSGEPHAHSRETSEPSRTEMRREQRKFEAEKKKRIERLQKSSQEKTAPPAETAPSEKHPTNLIYRGKKATSTGNRLWNNY